MRTGPVDVCVAVVAGLPPATVLAWALPETVLFTTGCEGGVDLVARTGSALLAPGWTVPPQAAVAHLRAGSSFGTGGGVMVTNGGFDVVGGFDVGGGGVEVDGGFKVGGIVGGGCTPARDDRGITAKFG
jgi:hypothetical protein